MTHAEATVAFKNASAEYHAAQAARKKLLPRYEELKIKMSQLDFETTRAVNRMRAASTAIFDAVIAGDKG